MTRLDPIYGLLLGQAGSKPTQMSKPARIKGVGTIRLGGSAPMQALNFSKLFYCARAGIARSVWKSSWKN